MADDCKLEPDFAVSAGRRSHRARSFSADAGSGARSVAAVAAAIVPRPLRRARARAVAGRWRGKCQPGPARQPVAAVRPGWCRRGAEARSDRRAWHRHRSRARDLRVGDPVDDGRDVSGREPSSVAPAECAMSDNPFSLWVYLSQSPLLWLTVTLLTYAVADAVSQATHRNPLANPVLHSMWIIGAFLLLTGTSYTTYFSGAQFVHFLLGPATVALAVPLYENRKVVMASILPMLVALVVGCVTAIVSVVWLAEAFGLPRTVVLSLAPKSVTAGVAMGISESLGADPSLTAVAVVLTGIMGAIIVTPLMNRLGITDFRARGFAVGLASHGIGTARAFQVDAVAGVFAGIAMSLNALVTSLLVPLAATLLVRGP